MGVDYREQYKPEHLEPFFPHEIVKMIIVVLCTLAVLMFLVVLPTLLDSAGIEGVFHEEQPADPTVTPPHIRPEWYFLAVYQFLKLMPADFLGIDGKALGIFIQGIAVAIMLFLPFWFPLKPAQLNPSAWGRGLSSFCLMLVLLIIPAGIINYIRATLPEGFRDIIHPMFVWPVLAVADYLIAGFIYRRLGFTDAFKWLKLFTVALVLIGFQYLAFIVVLGQGFSWVIPAGLAYLIGAIPFLIAGAVIIRFVIQRINGKDELSRVKLLLGFVTEGIILFNCLTVWAMWPADGIYTEEHGWHHETKSFTFTLLVIAAAVIILYAFLVTERRIIKKTLKPDERDKII